MTHAAEISFLYFNFVSWEAKHLISSPNNCPFRSEAFPSTLRGKQSTKARSHGDEDGEEEESINNAHKKFPRLSFPKSHRFTFASLLRLKLCVAKGCIALHFFYLCCAYQFQRSARSNAKAALNWREKWLKRIRDDAWRKSFDAAISCKIYSKRSSHKQLGVCLTVSGGFENNSRTEWKR